MVAFNMEIAREHQSLHVEEFITLRYTMATQLWQGVSMDTDSF
ncbi:MAG: hypothetical protein ETSY2_26675 [Candidatus Entotheonella gemina]|uniref:Uncharacterized protein n=1 Tax=Candidatus Entotheonella gemina TaxID=1429439 RepID=W4M3Q7_9BACT|nr:MAG: hypothetical protein ETSY2_26675 [Candidatus Entotheonella gemina]